MESNVERFDRKTILARTLVADGERSIHSVTRDISRTGVFVETSAPVEVGDRIRLFIEDKRGAQVLWVVSRIVRVSHGVGFAAEFMIDDPDARRDFGLQVDGLPSAEGTRTALLVQRRRPS
jgi:hypothetical protein